MDITKGLIVFAFALVAGFMGGQVGGGGLLTLPALLLVGLDPLLALGTNRVGSCVYVFINIFSYNKHKKTPVKHHLLFGFAALLGAMAGVILLFYLNIDQVLLKQITILVLLAITLITYFKKDLGQSDNELKLSKKNWMLTLFFVFLISFYGGIFSMATTTIFATLFVLKKQSYMQGMVYALVLSFVVLFSTAIVFIFKNQVYYPLAIIQAVGSIIGSHFGIKFALKKGNLWLKNLTLVLMLMLLLKLGWEVFF